MLLLEIFDEVEPFQLLVNGVMNVLGSFLLEVRLLLSRNALLVNEDVTPTCRANRDGDACLNDGLLARRRALAIIVIDFMFKNHTICHKYGKKEKPF